MRSCARKATCCASGLVRGVTNVTAAWASGFAHLREEGDMLRFNLGDTLFAASPSLVVVGIGEQGGSGVLFGGGCSTAGSGVVNAGVVGREGCIGRRRRERGGRRKEGRFESFYRKGWG